MIDAILAGVDPTVAAETEAVLATLEVLHASTSAPPVPRQPGDLPGSGP